MNDAMKTFVEACERWSADEDYSDESIAGFAERDVPMLCRVIREQSKRLATLESAARGVMAEVDVLPTIPSNKACQRAIFKMSPHFATLGVYLGEADS